MKYTSIGELLAAFKSGLEDDKFWEDAPTFGGQIPHDTQEVWSWDEARLLVGTCGDDAEIVTRLDHALTEVMDDPQARGMEFNWAEVWRAVARGESVAEDWAFIVGLDAMLSKRADEADAAGWTGIYPAALRGLAMAAGAVSELGKPSRAAIHAAACAGSGGYKERIVGDWLAGKKPVPWPVWAALRGQLHPIAYVTR